MIFVSTLSDFVLILEANIHVIAGEISFFLPQPNCRDNKMTQQLGLWDEKVADVQGKVQLREHFHCLNFIMVVGGFFLFCFLFLFLLLLLQERTLFIDGWLISVHPFGRGEGSWRIREKTMMMWKIRESWAATELLMGQQSWASSQWNGLDKFSGH